VLRQSGLDYHVLGDLKGFALELRGREIEKGLEILTLALKSGQPAPPPRFTLRWAVPSHDVIGQWTTSRHLNKTIRPDWAGSRLQASMFAREAPLSCLFGGDDRNVLSFAVSDALNTVLTAAGVREEDGFIYNEAVFFSERHEDLAEYTVELRVDRRRIPYHRVLRDVAEWWAKQPGYAPAPVPEPARLPVYSTWYNYHQSVDADVLLKELAVAKELGFDSIIVDDGWQTLDTGRGYAFTGDWEPERIPDMKGFVDAAHRLGVKVVLWYAVPFVGKNAKVAAPFQSKSLRFDERLGAYVLDPRFPEVRAYLTEIYRKAIREWGIDGFKLDFIDRFVADADTVLEARGGRDFASVNAATDRMMTDILAELTKIRPDVMIEFRQPYIGPLIRKYGNMFRASDCPNSYVANRVKTTDLRLLSGTTAVHADMIMWHPSEPVETAALQLLNILFSVPQVSVRLRESPKEHLEMLKFYTAYWNANRAILLDAPIEAFHPAANYPMLAAAGAEKRIVGLYDDVAVRWDGGASRLDVINGKSSSDVIVAVGQDRGRYRATVRDCRGRVVRSETLRLDKRLHAFGVPASGLLALEPVE